MFATATTPHTVRLKTLAALRWFAVIGQAVTVLVVQYVLGFDLPLAACLSVIALSAWLNVATSMHLGNVQRLPARTVAWLLAYDITQLTVLMTLTGGLENPFAFFVLAPVSIAAISLPMRYTLPLALFAVVTSTLIAFFYWPLPWSSDHAQAMVFPALYIFSTWIANLVAIVFISAYAWQVAEESRLMADALTATELVLAREQHLSQLDGLGGAAAHEPSTPLATISVVAKELERALGPASPHAEDVKLLREQAERCRVIMSKLSALPAEGGSFAPFERARLSALIEEVVAPHRNFGIAIEVVLPVQREGEPVVQRSPAILYGLGNLVENAVDFATSRVEIAIRWSDQDVAVTISDDGPGFPPEILRRIGEPYVTSRRRSGAEGEESGLGLGFFIAKTLLERSGATVAYLNRHAPERGAVISIRWPRPDIEVTAEEGTLTPP